MFLSGGDGNGSKLRCLRQEVGLGLMSPRQLKRVGGRIPPDHDLPRASERDGEDVPGIDSHDVIELTGNLDVRPAAAIPSVDVLACILRSCRYRSGSENRPHDGCCM